MAKKIKKVETSKTLTIPFKCLSCGGNQYSVLVEMPRTDYEGLLPDGTEYVAVLRNRVQCDCGQVGVERGYLLRATDE